MPARLHAIIVVRPGSEEKLLHLLAESGYLAEAHLS